jgi:hypothetical protein
MISAGNHEFGVRHLLGDQIERLDHEFKALVSAPLAKGKNAVGGSAPSREIGEFRSARKNAMGAQVDVIASIFVIQNLAVSGHEHRNGI